ncbi:hypothetical protein NHX12_032851 [Muraenolepis orangiensis]|uniref:Uncharacterized protein n=1 Tax=Muraenolepis orangiensis TaxID=630683 RepID=A0A9Q0II65_9TELE|nr:hypothetical protein NHX12_032851 [Muraenolepis orangiensis]
MGNRLVGRTVFLHGVPFRLLDQRSLQLIRLAFSAGDLETVAPEHGHQAIELDPELVPQVVASWQSPFYNVWTDLSFLYILLGESRNPVPGSRLVVNTSNLKVAFEGARSGCWLLLARKRADSQRVRDAPSRWASWCTGGPWCLRPDKTP